MQCVLKMSAVVKEWVSLACTVDRTMEFNLGDKECAFDQACGGEERTAPPPPLSLYLFHIFYFNDPSEVIKHKIYSTITPSWKFLVFSRTYILYFCYFHSIQNIHVKLKKNK